MKKNSGFTLIELIFALSAMTIAVLGIFSFLRSVGHRNNDIETYTAMQLLATSLAEQMQLDIKNGVILTTHNYSIDTESHPLSADVVIDETLLYGEYLYFITADIRSDTDVRVVTRFFLRSDGT